MGPHGIQGMAPVVIVVAQQQGPVIFGQIIAQPQQIGLPEILQGLLQFRTALDALIKGVCKIIGPRCQDRAQTPQALLLGCA